MRSLLGVFLMLVGLGTLVAQAPKFSNDFLNIGVGARAHAMSGSVTSSVHDVTASFWNPAALTSMEAPFQVGAMHAEWFGGVGNYDFISIAKSFGKNKNAAGGLSIIRMAIDQIPNTFRLIDDDGSINYDAIEEFSVADYAFLLSYGQRIRGSVWRVGGNVKVIHRNVGQFANAWGFGLDVGMQAVWDHWRLGVNVRDITSTFNAWTFSFSDEEKIVLAQTNNDIPESSIESTLPTAHIGLGYLFYLSAKSSLLAEANMVVSTDGRESGIISNNRFSIDPKMGLEFGYNNIFWLRAGVSNFQQLTDDVDGTKTELNFEPTVGLGVKMGRLQLDYAYTDIGDLSVVESSHIISATLSFVRRDKSKPPVSE